MATYTYNFGLLTRSGFGEKDAIGTPGETITGTGASDWVINSRGAIVPSGTYGNVKTYSKGAGETYNLTLVTTGVTVDINMQARISDIAHPPGSTSNSNQLQRVLNTTRTSTGGDAGGVLYAGDTVRLRDGVEFGYSALNARFLPSIQPGHGTITNPGSGYTDGNYYFCDTANVSGSGTGAKLTLVVSGGQVVVAMAAIPGTGYQAGDIITTDLGAGVSSIPGGSGFQFKVIDLDARITITSETPDTTTTIDGNNTWGGSARINAFEVASGAAGSVLRALYKFEYIDFIHDTDTTPLKGGFVVYRNQYCYGMAAHRCYFANEDAVSYTNLVDDFFACRRAEFTENYVYRPDRGVVCNFNGIFDGITTVVDNNVFVGPYVDCVDIGGNYNQISRNFARDFNDKPGSHSDFMQHAGYSDGVSHGPTLDVYENVVLAFGPTSEPQAVIFVTDVSAPATTTGVNAYNNIILTGGGPNPIRIQNSVGPLATRNTNIIAADYPLIGGTAQAKISFFGTVGVGGTVTQNYTNLIETDQQTGTPTVADNKVVSPGSAAAYQEAFPNYAWGPFTTKAQVIAALTPTAGVSVDVGGAMLADGRYVGALFPDGSWNDGTVFNGTPATLLTASASSSTTTTGQPVNITIQADAPVSGNVAVDVSIAGVTGSASPDPATILSGTVSKVTAFTPTSAGTATLTFTNDGGLTNPDPVVITVNAPSVEPTAYTMTASQSTTTLGVQITITFVLNAPATDAVTITGAFSGVSGAWTGGSTVVIPNGDTTGQLVWAGSSTGTATFSATNDFGLPNPADVMVDVVGINAAQLIALGIRPSLP